MGKLISCYLMDVDDQHVATGTQHPKKPAVAPVDDVHPFELENYISGYTGTYNSTPCLTTVNACTGRTAIDRLIHIVRLCPDIAPEAFSLAVQHIHQSRDPSLYQNLLANYEYLVNSKAVKDGSYELPNPSVIAQLDPKWVDEVVLRNTSEKVKLEVELKTYTGNMIRESIRVSGPPKCS